MLKYQYLTISFKVVLNFKEALYFWVMFVEWLLKLHKVQVLMNDHILVKTSEYD